MKLEQVWDTKKPVVVLGAQWGDEGKGKLVDFLTEEAKLVVRFNGGANAGHTIIANGQKTVTHLLPSGIVRAGTRNLVGPGVVCSLDVLKDELGLANQCGAEVLLDRSAPVIHGIHRWLDAARELAGGGLGTTKRGIGPAYEDISSRRSVRLGDLTNPDRVRKALTEGSYYIGRANEAKAFAHLELPPFPTLDALVDEIMAYRSEVVPRLCDGRALVASAVHADHAKTLFEGAQGVMLDVFGGSSPYTTSSMCTAAGVAATFGVYDFGAVIGVAKAYATRVGAGPFPTELNDGVGNELRKLGGEYGATTGRPRRCGWLDLVALRYAIRMGGITHLVITKLDVLGRLGMEIPVADRYLFEGREVQPQETLTSRVLREAKPLHMGMPGWSEDLSTLTAHQPLPEAVLSYIHMIQWHTGVEVIAAGLGAEREQLRMFG